MESIDGEERKQNKRENTLNELCKARRPSNLELFGEH